MIVPPQVKAGIIPRTYVPSASSQFNREVVLDFAALAAAAGGTIELSGKGPWSVGSTPIVYLNDPALINPLPLLITATSGIRPCRSLSGNSGAQVTVYEKTDYPKYGIPLLSLIPDLAPSSPVRLSYDIDPFITRLTNFPLVDGTAFTSFGASLQPPNLAVFEPIPPGTSKPYRARGVALGNNNWTGTSSIGARSVANRLIPQDVFGNYSQLTNSLDIDVAQSDVSRVFLSTPLGIFGQAYTIAIARTPAVGENAWSPGTSTVVSSSSVSDIPNSWDVILKNQRMASAYLFFMGGGSSFSAVNTPALAPPGIKRVRIQAMV